MSPLSWRASATIATTATPEAIWHRWTEVELWPADDPDCRWATIDGDYRVGATGTVKAAGPASHFRVTELDPLRRMVFEIAVPLGTLRFPHTVEPLAEGVLLTHAVEITGPLAQVYGAVIGQVIRRGLPEVVRLVATHAL